MRTAFVCFTVALICLQGSDANFISEVKEEAHSILREVNSLFDRGQGLLELIETATKIHKEVAAGPFGMNFEACENVTTSLLNDQALIVDTFKQGYGAFKNITTSLNDLLNCPSLNPIKGVTCIMDDIKTLKAAVDSIKPLVADFKDKIENAYVELHGEILDCVGFEPKQ